jgi:hypothetical protein
LQIAIRKKHFPLIDVQANKSYTFASKTSAAVSAVASQQL